MRTIFMLISFLFLLSSCLREEDRPASEEVCGEDAKICLSFVEANHTKAFDNSLATAVEKGVNSAKLFIFKSGVKIFENVLSSTEISGIATTPVTLTVPGMQASTSYDYYMIVNHGNVTAATPADLQAIIENDIASYNGAWSTVSDATVAPNRSGGFVMTGHATKPTTATITDVQSVTIQVKRIVAKLDITTSINQNIFGNAPTATYQGTVGIDSVKVVKTQGTTPLVITTPAPSVGSLTLAKQIPNPAPVNVTYQNRFYVFENGALTAGSRVQLYIYGTYTNGLISSPVVYTPELSTDGTGAIVRNGAYAINISVNGLSGTQITVTVTLSDWETLVTQTTTNVGS